MALKPDRYEEWVFTEFYMNEVAEAGSFVVFNTGTSGVGAMLDDANAKVKLPDVANGSGELAAGILLNNVVNLDLTRTHINPFNRDTQLGSKVGVAKTGQFTTDVIKTGESISVGKAAYFTADGEFTSTSGTGATRVGTWLGGKDADGFAKIDMHVV